MITDQTIFSLTSSLLLSNFDPISGIGRTNTAERTENAARTKKKNVYPSPPKELAPNAIRAGAAKFTSVDARLVVVFIMEISFPAFSFEGRIRFTSAISTAVYIPKPKLKMKLPTITHVTLLEKAKVIKQIPVKRAAPKTNGFCFFNLSDRKPPRIPAPTISIIAGAVSAMISKILTCGK